MSSNKYIGYFKSNKLKNQEYSDAYDHIKEEYNKDFNVEYAIKNKKYDECIKEIRNEEAKYRSLTKDVEGNLSIIFGLLAPLAVLIFAGIQSLYYGLGPVYAIIFTGIMFVVISLLACVTKKIDNRRVMYSIVLCALEDIEKIILAHKSSIIEENIRDMKKFIGIK